MTGKVKAELIGEEFEMNYVLQNDVDMVKLDEQITIDKFEDLIATKGAGYVIDQLDPAIKDDLFDAVSERWLL